MADALRDATFRSAAFAMLAACAAAVACSTSASSSSAPTAAVVPAADAAPAPLPPGIHPRLLYAPEQKATLLARENVAPFDAIWQHIRAVAAQDPVAPAAATWSTKVWQTNGGIAQANAVLAWAKGDADAAAKAKALLLGLADDFEDCEENDVDIALPPILLPYANAWDLLAATPWATGDELAQARDHITTVTRKFVARYLDEPLYRTTAFVVTQNNHPLRAASAIGYVALLFPDDPDATRWLDWATDQIDYLLGPKGHYVQSDGAISEGPFYFGFAFAAVAPFLIALDKNDPPGAVHHHTCITRNSADPWTDNGCVEGEAFTLTNPLRNPAFQKTLDWDVALRRPSGARAVLDDCHVALLNGGALMTSYGAGPHLRWDWEENVARPLDTTGFGDLSPWYLAYVTDAPSAAPPWQNRFFPEGGQAVFRSGWGPNDLWLMVVADHGPARKTVHNHADGASFALSAYGEDLLVDTGYYKPDSLHNPLTTDAPSHDVVLVDGVGAPPRGTLNDWGDTDAFLENTVDGDAIAWAEARVSYQQATIRRGFGFVRKRYVVVADRIQSEVATPRAFQWRAHLWAGHEAGGSYAIAGDRVTVDRAQAGLAIAAATTAGAPAWVEPPFTALQPPFVHDVDGPGNHAVADATVNAVAPGFLVVLAPYAEGKTGADGPLTVTAAPAGAGGAAWTIDGVSASRGAFHDVAWMRGAGAPTTLALPGAHAVETDADVVLLSEAGEWALVAGGSYVKLDGVALIAGNTAPVATMTR